MDPGGAGRSWVALGIGVGAVVAVVGAQRWLASSQVPDGVASGSVQVLADLVAGVFLLVAGIGVLMVVMNLLSTRPAGGPDAPTRPMGPLAFLAVLALLTALVLFGHQLARPTRPSAIHVPVALVPTALPADPAVGQSAPGRPRPGADAAADSVDLSSWLDVLGGLLLAALAALTLGAMIRRRPETRAVAGADDPPGADDDLYPVPLVPGDPAAEPDPRRAVVAAYHQLLASAAGHSLARRRHEAATEHLDRLGRSWPRAAAAARPLVAAFDRARYSEHPITEADRAAALDSLRRFEAEVDPAPAQLGTGW